MTTTQMTVPLAAAPDELERFTRRLATLDVAWRLDVEHYAGEVRLTLSLPAGVAIPGDAGPSETARALAALMAEHDAVLDALTAEQVQRERAEAERDEARRERDEALLRAVRAEARSA